MMDLLVANGPALLFYLFALMAVGSAIAVISLRNPVYSAISLLVTFLSVAALFVLRCLSHRPTRSAGRPSRERRE